MRHSPKGRTCFLLAILLHQNKMIYKWPIHTTQFGRNKEFFLDNRWHKVASNKQLTGLYAWKLVNTDPNSMHNWSISRLLNNIFWGWEKATSNYDNPVTINVNDNSTKIPRNMQGYFNKFSAFEGWTKQLVFTVTFCSFYFYSLTVWTIKLFKMSLAIEMFMFIIQN